MRKLLFAPLLAMAALLLAGAASASSSIVYDNVPNPLPGNVPSLGYEATSTSEFGGGMQLAGTDRQNPTVTVLMSSWACQSGAWYSGDCSSTSGATFSHPITLNIYAVGAGNSVGSLIGTSTQTFDMPYRPSSDPVNCTGASAGEWSDGTGCFNGKGFTISFHFDGLTLPDQVVITVAYNTSHYGYSPIGNSTCNATTQGCPYDSLNVGVTAPPSVGTPLPTDSDAYLNSSWGGAYCDGGAAGTGSLRLDASCWGGYLPAIRVSAEPPLVGPPASRDDCMNDGWQSFNNPAFKNQGDCASYVATGGKH